VPDGLIQYGILLPILYIGLRASVEDFRFGKIYRHHISLGLSVGAAWYLFLMLFYGLFLSDWSVATQLLPRVVAATLVGFAIAAGMWWFDVWSAGDAKLFTVFTFLAPPSVYMTLQADYLSSFILLVNAYTVAFVVITGDFLVRLSRRIAARTAQYRVANPEGREELKAQALGYLVENGPGWLKSFLGFTFILVIVRLLRSLVQGQLDGVIHLDDTLLFLMLFLAFRPLHLLFQIRAVAVLVIAGLLGYVGYLFYIDPSGKELGQVAGIGLLALGLMTFRQVYSYWSKLVEVATIAQTDLKAHMIISERTREALVMQQVFSKEEMKQIGVEGLNAEQAQRIRELYANAEQPSQVEVEKTIPFAPFLFLGLLLTFFTHDVLMRF
jgi:Flp pilus assembly protein protease CpaA